MRIAFAGGGTGGHVFPVRSLIQYIHTHHADAQHPSHDFFWFGESPSLEQRIAMQLQTTIPELHFLTITSGKYRREKEWDATLRNVIDIGKLAFGIVRSFVHLIRHRIDVVFCKGGYVSLPVVIAAWMLRKPILLHESDTKPGLANRICSRFATTIFTAFEGVFPGKEIVVGQILADDLVPQNWPACDHVTSDAPTNILVTGGSQGAQSMYEPLIDIIRALPSPLTAHFHIVLGTANQSLHAAFAALPQTTVYGFIEQKTMGELLTLCDVAITRGGTTSLAEQQLFNLRKIIIPIPRTHDQKKNAMYYRYHHGDIMVLQDVPTYAGDFAQAAASVKEFTKAAYENPTVQIAHTKETIWNHLSALQK